MGAWFTKAPNDSFPQIKNWMLYSGLVGMAAVGTGVTSIGIPLKKMQWANLLAAFFLGIGLYGLVLGAFFYTVAQVGETNIVKEQVTLLVNGLFTPSASVVLNAIPGKPITSGKEIKRKDEFKSVLAFLDKKIANLPKGGKDRHKRKVPMQLMQESFMFFSIVAAVCIAISLTTFGLGSTSDWSEYGWITLETLFLLGFVFATQTCMTMFVFARYSNVSIPAVSGYLVKAFAQSN